MPSSTPGSAAAIWPGAGYRVFHPTKPPDPAQTSATAAFQGIGRVFAKPPDTRRETQQLRGRVPGGHLSPYGGVGANHPTPRVGAAVQPHQPPNSRTQ